MRPPRSAGFVIVNTLFAWSTIAIAASVFWPVYQDAHFLVAVGGAMLLGTLIAVLGSGFRWPGVAVMLAGVVAFLLTGVQLAVPSQALYGGVAPSLEGLVALFSELALGWRHLLTITLPVGSYQALLVPAFAAVLVVTITSLSVALRTRVGELGVIPPVLLFGLGIVFGPTTAPDGLWLALAAMASVLMWIVWRRSSRRRAAIQLLASQATDVDGRPMGTRADRGVALRGIVGAVIILAVASAGSIVATTALPPTGDRQVLRSAVDQPFDPRDYASPLAGLRRYLKDGRADQTMLTVSGMPSGGRVRIATLDSYDGIVYAVGSADVDSASGSFVRVPTTVDQSRSGTRQVEVRVAVEGYSGVWLPTVGDLESVDFRGADASRLRDAFYFNSTSDTGAVIGGVRSGDSYRLKAVLPTEPSSSTIAGSTPGAARVPRLAALPDALGAKLESYDSGVDGKGAQLIAAIEGLRREGYISHGIGKDEPPSRSGHAADRITELVSGTRMVGDAEQYAVAAALMARQLGFPARVVFGFVPPADSGADVTFTGSDISAWIEVDTAEHGWVTLDPVPPVRPIPEEQPKDPTQIARPQTPVEPPPDEPQPRTQQAPPDSTQNDDRGPDALLLALLAVLRVGGWIALALGLLASPLLIVVAAKSRRRRLRRRAPTPVQRISGAWDEFRDEALDFGYATAGTSTRIEFAETVGLEQSKTLAAVADRAVFAPALPDRDDAEKVWVALEDLHDSLGRGLTRWQRFRARVSLRSLGRYPVARLLTRRGPR